MTYLTENPWPGIVLFGAVALVAFLSGHPKGKLVSLLSLVAAVGLYFLEQQLISTGEEVEIAIQEMLDDFKSEDLDAITDSIAGQDEQLVQQAKRGLELVDLRDDFSIRSVETTLSDDQQTATAFIRANGKVSVKNQSMGEQHVPTYWRTVWVLSGERWKLKNATRLNVANGEEMDMFGKK